MKKDYPYILEIVGADDEALPVRIHCLTSPALAEIVKMTLTSLSDRPKVIESRTSSVAVDKTANNGTSSLARVVAMLEMRAQKEALPAAERALLVIGKIQLEGELALKAGQKIFGMKAWGPTFTKLVNTAKSLNKPFWHYVEQKGSFKDRAWKATTRTHILVEKLRQEVNS